MEIEQIKPSEAALTLVYKTIWQRLPNKSFVSGLWLRTYYGTPLFFNCFHHVLPEDKYKFFKYYFGNIILLTPGESALLKQGTEEERISYALDLECQSRNKVTAEWNAVKEIESDLKKLYANSFPTTRGMFVNYRYTIEDQARIIGKLNAQFWKDFQK